MTYNYVTVSGTFPILTGTVTFTPPPEVTDVTGTIPVLGPGPVVCKVSGGSFTSAPLLASDNVGLLPAGWTWLTTVALTGQKAYTYPVLVPGASGSTATLSSLAVSPSGTTAAAPVSGSIAVLTTSYGAVSGTLNTATYGAFFVTLSGAPTFTFAGAAAGFETSFTLYLKQPASGTIFYTPVWPSGTVSAVQWQDSVPPSLSAANSAVDILVFASPDGGVNWYGSQAGVNYA